MGCLWCVFCVLGSGFGVFLLIPSFRPPPLSAGAGLGNQPALLRHKTRFLRFWAEFWGVSCLIELGLGWFLRFFVLPTPPPRGRGCSGYYCHSDCGTGLCVCFLLLGGIISPRPLLLRLWRYFGFSLFRRHVLTRPPLPGDMAAVFLDAFSVPYA